MGYKTFGSEPLYAADVNDYLMRQSIIVVANQTARDAIPSPVEGMTVYRQDTDQFETYTGTAWNTGNWSSTVQGSWTLASTQSIATGTFTLLGAGTAVGTVSTSLSNTSGAVTIANPGIYEVQAQVRWVGTGSAGTRRATIVTKNTTSINGGGILSGGANVGTTVAAPTGGVDQVVSMRTSRFLATGGDVIRVFAFQDTAGAMNIAPGVATDYMGQTTVTVQRVS